jgi:hypothetical protein
MKLSLKQKAFIQAVGILVLSIAVGIVTTIVVSKIPSEAYPYIGIAALLGVALNFLYSLNVNRLEHQESLKRLKELN